MILACTTRTELRTVVANFEAVSTVSLTYPRLG